MPKIIELERDSYGIIYMFRNKLTNHRYIGQTRFPEKRILKHISGCTTAAKKGQESLIHLAIKEYGVDNFDISVVRYCDSQEELNEWEVFYIREYDCVGESGYNKVCRGFIENVYSDKDIKHFAKKSQGKKLEGVKAKYFCVYPARNKRFVLRMRVNRKHRTKTFDTEIEAAEMYDCTALFVYGPEATLNFPDKRKEYLKRDLESIYNFVVTPPEKPHKYSWVLQQKSGRWSANPTTLKNEKTLYIGSFETEEEAAQMADKLMFFFNDVPLKKLNFPDLAENFNKEELKRSFEKYYHASPNRFKQNKNRGTKLTRLTWVSYLTYQKKTFYISHRHKSQEDAQLSIKEYLSEFLKEEPNIENLKHLKFSEVGASLMKNKKELEESFVIRMHRLYEHLLNDS